MLLVSVFAAIRIITTLFIGATDTAAAYISSWNHVLNGRHGRFPRQKVLTSRTTPTRRHDWSSSTFSLSLFSSSQSEKNGVVIGGGWFNRGSKVLGSSISNMPSQKQQDNNNNVGCLGTDGLACTSHQHQHEEEQVVVVEDRAMSSSQLRNHDELKQSNGLSIDDINNVPTLSALASASTFYNKDNNDDIIITNSYINQQQQQQQQQDDMDDLFSSQRMIQQHLQTSHNQEQELQYAQEQNKQYQFDEMITTATVTTNTNNNYFDSSTTRATTSSSSSTTAARSKMLRNSTISSHMIHPIYSSKAKMTTCNDPIVAPTITSFMNDLDLLPLLKATCTATAATVRSDHQNVLVVDDSIKKITIDSNILHQLIFQNETGYLNCSNAFKNALFQSQFETPASANSTASTNNFDIGGSSIDRLERRGHNNNNNTLYSQISHSTFNLDGQSLDSSSISSSSSSSSSSSATISPTSSLSAAEYAAFLRRGQSYRERQNQAEQILNETLQEIIINDKFLMYDDNDNDNNLNYNNDNNNTTTTNKLRLVSIPPVRELRRNRPLLERMRHGSSSSSSFQARPMMVRRPSPFIGLTRRRVRWNEQPFEMRDLPQHSPSSSATPTTTTEKIVAPDAGNDNHNTNIEEEKLLLYKRPNMSNFYKREMIKYKQQASDAHNEVQRLRAVITALETDKDRDRGGGQQRLVDNAKCLKLQAAKIVSGEKQKNHCSPSFSSSPPLSASSSWVQVKDPETGDVFLLNESTGEVSWDDVPLKKN